jgi:hypothetical protein
MTRLRALVCTVCLLLVAGPAAAQELPLTVDVPLPGVERYDDAIPTPQEVIGHTIGERHTYPHQVVDYFQAVAAASDRVAYGEHARTYEGRKLVHAIVTAPANHANLETIRTQTLRLSRAPDDVSDDALTEMPGIVYMGYGVHGNESSATEAALLLLYHLAAGEGPSVEAALDSLVILIDPMLNPDGRDRFADWVNRNRGAASTTDPQNREHNEAWPGGRTNHYLFDLNRDWLPMVHPESRGRMALWHRWHPQVSTDYHEMGSDATYFFQPGVPSRTNLNTPDRNQALTAAIGEYHAAALDRIGQLYYTRETFDDYYYGKGSTYPDVNGSIGILFEQASSRGLKRETAFGVLDYGTTVRNQFATSLSSLRAAVEMREELLRFQRDFYREAEVMAGESEVEGYLLGLERGRTRAQQLGRLLQRHQIRVHDLAREVTVDGTTYRPGSAYLVPMQQPQSRLLKALMERVDTFPDSLFYDVSTWTLPLAFDVDHAEVRRDVDALAGAELDAIDPDGGAVVGERSDYAYLIEWGSYHAPRALYRLMDLGVRPVLLEDPITALVGGEERSFDRGTIVIPVEQVDTEPEAIHRAVQAIAAEDHVPVYAVESGMTPTGPDLGSRNAAILDKPEVLIVSGSGTGAYDVGEVWYLLSERQRIPVTLMDQDEMAEADLDRYTTIILASHYGGDLPADRLKAWVQAGGRFVALSSGVDWAVEQGLLSLQELEVDTDSLLVGRPYAELSRTRGAQVLGGSIFEVVLDTTHPVAYGFPERLPVFQDDNRAYALPSAPGETVGVYAAAPTLSGYISEEWGDILGGSAAVVAAESGRGSVIALPFDPDFRGFWYGTDGLILNAVFFGGAF